MLKPGDTMVVLSDPGFGNRWRDRSAFLLVARLGGVTPAATKKAWVVGAVVLGVVLSAAFGLQPVLDAALVGAFALVITGVLTPAEARGTVVCVTARRSVARRPRAFALCAVGSRRRTPT